MQILGGIFAAAKMFDRCDDALQMRGPESGGKLRADLPSTRRAAASVGQRDLVVDAELVIAEDVLGTQ